MRQGEINITTRHTEKLTSTEVPVTRALMVAVERAFNKDVWSVEDSLDELRHLATTNGIEAVASVTQKLREPHPTHYVGKGKLAEIVALKEELDCDLVLFDDELTPLQQRNLEKELNGQVLDRTGLILEIFAKRAQTHEGRLQVELAQMEYLLPRLTRQWTHLSRQFGAIGARGGPGETQLEIDRRHAKQRMAEIKAQIERVRTHRALYRDQRQSEGIPIIALVGYTNAGKSTLLRALTGANVLVEDKLFATLDPTTRRVKLPGGREALITDTVGFIQNLPTALVAAFRATLEELNEADVLLHVVDITHPRGYEQASTVASILREIGVANKPIITALNKVDYLVGDQPGSLEELIAKSDPTSAGSMLREIAAHYPNGVALSAQRGWGLDTLMATVDRVLGEKLVDITVLMPYGAGKLAALFRQKASSTRERHTEDGSIISGRLPVRFLETFQPYALSNQSRPAAAAHHDALSPPDSAPGSVPTV